MSGAQSTWAVAVPAGAELGERPVWDGEGLLWVDIMAGHLHRHTPGGGDEIVLALTDGGRPVPIAAAACRRGGGYVLATAAGFQLAGPLGRGGGAGAGRVLIEEGAIRPAGMAAGVRFNDGACDPAGRFWAGTVAADVRPGAAALYRLDPDGTVTTVLDGVTESNGLGWSLDGGTFYYIDSGEPEPRIRAFGFEAAAGELGRSRDLVRFPGGGPVPDGLIVDAEDTLWVAIWGAGQVHRYAPDGELLAVLPVPASQPTCPAFGGPGLDDLYLTTAWHDMTPGQRAAEPLAGHVLRSRPGARGRPAFSFGG
jgi:sugar lactone lactonase YvrE